MNLVLLVDGDPVFGSLVERDFFDHGLTVEVAITVDAAVLLLRARDYSAVIIGLAMPREHCAELLETEAARLPAFIVCDILRDDARDWLLARPQIRGVYDRKQIVPREFAKIVAASIA